MRRFLKYLPLLLVLVTLAAHFCLLWVHTAYENGARAGVQGVNGNQFGFNHPITWELLGLAAPHVTLVDVIDRLETLDYMLLVAVLVAIPFCVSWQHNPLYRWHRRYLALQLIFFPTGWLGFLGILACSLEFVLTGGMLLDGEFFDDGIAAIMTHGIWVNVCLWYVVFSVVMEKTNPDLGEASVHPISASPTA